MQRCIVLHIYHIIYCGKKISKSIYMPEKNSIEELKKQFSILEKEIDKLLGIIDDAEEKIEHLKCALWNIQEIITENNI